MILSLLVALAHADDPPAEPPPADPPPADLDEAQETKPLTKRELRLLKPSPFHLPPNPRGQVDFTAYTLEWGEVKVGLANITVGVLPHTQLGTSVPLDVLRIPNATLKVHATEGGPFDIAGYANYYLMPREDFRASYLSTGLLASLEIALPWSIHLGGGYVSVDAEGAADLSTIGRIFQAGDEPLMVTWFFRGEAINLTVATDLRLNRRDSIILRGESIVWASSDSNLPDAAITFAGLDDAFATQGFVPLDKAAAASISWQFAWEHIEARVGVGVSSAPWGWLLQSTELSYRFGGKTRVRERRQRKTWEKNVDDLGTPPKK